LSLILLADTVRMLVTVLGMAAEFERKFIRECQPGTGNFKIEKGRTQALAVRVYCRRSGDAAGECQVQHGVATRS
jgi:DNA invertase Pin-like site-specific DNA recombinase